MLKLHYMHAMRACQQVCVQIIRLIRIRARFILTKFDHDAQEDNMLRCNCLPGSIVLVSFASYGHFFMDNDVLAVVLHDDCRISDWQFAWAIFIYSYHLHITSFRRDKCSGQFFLWPQD